MAPTKKAPGQVIRRNKDQVKWVTLTAPDGETEIEIPAWTGRLGNAAAREYWESIWLSPMAKTYQLTDRFAIKRLCILHGKFADGKASASEQTILGQLEDKFGLSLKSRRGLQFEIEKAAGPGQAHNRQPLDDVRDQRAVGEDRRDRLSRVK